MRIIYITHWRFPSDKTMSPLIMRTCEELSRQGNEVELWTPRRKNAQYSRADPFAHYGIDRLFVIKKLPVLDLIGVIPGSGAFWVMIITFAVSVWWKSILIPEETIWYSHDIRDIVLLYKKNIFAEIHDFYESSFNFLNKSVYGRLRGLVVTNRIKMDHLEKKYGIPRDKMIHLPNAVDLARFNRKETQEEARKKLLLPVEKKLVVYTGSLFAWKGIHTLALASSFLPEGAQILFAGGNEKERQEFQKFVDSNNLPGITVLPLPYEDLGRAPLFMRAADVLVLPNTAKDPVSKLETSPVKLFEYMASMTPIVASDLPSIRNIVDETMVKFFAPDDPARLAEAIRSVLEDTKSAEKRALVAIKETGRYSWDRRIKTITNFFDSVI